MKEETPPTTHTKKQHVEPAETKMAAIQTPTDPAAHYMLVLLCERIKQHTSQQPVPYTKRPKQDKEGVVPHSLKKALPLLR